VDSDRLNRWLTLGANIGVLIGIIFLAVELRQNNENLAVQQRAVNYTSVADSWARVSEHPQLSELISKDFGGETLSAAETVQLQAFWTGIHLGLQWAYEELPDDQFQRTLTFNRDDYAASPTYRSAWKSRRAFFDPEFVQYMDENVFIDR